MSMDSLRATFFAECEDLLDALNEGLNAMSDGTADTETVNAIFRAVHSIKGSAGAFALDDLVEFAHTYENVLDLIRSEALEVTPEVLKTIIRSSDILAVLVEEAHAETGNRPDSMDGVLRELSALSGKGGDSAAADPPSAEFVFDALPVQPISLDIAPTDAHFRISFAPHQALFTNSHDPVLLLTTLVGLGEAVIECDTSDVPDLDELDPSESYLSWEIALHGDIAEGEINAVFEFVDGLCTLTVDRQLPDQPDPPPSPNTGATPSATEVAAPAAADSPDAAPAASPKARQAGPAQTKRPTLRVDPERVDRLINTVGELIINQAVIAQKVVASGIAQNSDLMGDLDDYGYLARDIQEAVMAIRAQPVKPLFQRMARIAREAGDATGKDIDFVMEGEMTEVDKSLVERLSDPMTHLVRNAIDHGLEPTDDRLAVGKSPKGELRLSAEHRSGHVMIEVRDDGRGLNREKILKKAVEKGLVAEEAKLTNAEIDNLLFAPGFSTADAVTNLSGRGVGMDVVLTEIQAMGGRVTITSEPGSGSVFSIALPLTLAVLDGMVVTVGGQTLVMPLSCIVETIRPRPEDIRPFGREGFVLAIRGAYMPVVSLGALLGLDRGQIRPEKSVLVHISTGGASPIAVSVDDISDQRQVVIKSLEPNYGSIPGVSAATILGDGKIALIIDPDALAKMASKPGLSHSIRELEFEHE